MLGWALGSLLRFQARAGEIPTAGGGPGWGKAKNVILFIGDGFSIAHRTAARILSKGITEGKYHDKLALDDMPHMALIGTSGVDSVITDSANAMSAYTTGHKSSVNALGVYADRTPDTLDDPKVETISSLAKRKANMAVGVVTNTEVEDATPAGMVAHTRRRSDYDVIVQQFYESGVDVLMGGGSASFLPQSTPGSRRKDNEDFIAKFRQAGYTLATTDQEMREAAAGASTNIYVTNKVTGDCEPAVNNASISSVLDGSGNSVPNAQSSTSITNLGASIEQPVRSLKGFARVTLSPGESKQVSFPLGATMLAPCRNTC